MSTPDHLVTLFRAYRERNDAAFLKSAETLIQEELAANRHGRAHDLQRALGETKPVRPAALKPNGLASLPRDRRSGEELVSLENNSLDATKLVLNDTTRKQVSRIVEEHCRRLELARYGLQPKSRILFWGPPGCGKTLTAHCLAQEMSKPVGLVRLHAIISSFLGDTASHIQRVFEMAKASPMLLLLDEVDSIAKNRDDPNDVGELKRVVNSLLQAMDCFRAPDSLVVASSNHQYLLDPAIWRRFDDVVFFPMPTPSEREPFLHRLLSGIRYEGSMPALVKRTHSLSFAEIERIVGEAIKTAVLAGRETLRSSDICEQVNLFKSVMSAAKARPPRHRNE